MSGLLLEQLGRPLARALFASQPCHVSAWTSALLGQQQLQCRKQSCASASTSRSSNKPMYHLEVSIKAYEPRYLNQASTAIRDLMFINLAPQAAAVGASDVPGPQSSSSSSSSQGPPSPVNLAMPIQHIPIRLNWKRSRFTLIRGPHIDKRGREQFEMRKYKVLVRGATHSAQDVHWFLDSIRLYEFPGVQIQVSLNSNSYLTPSPLPAAAEPGQGAACKQQDDEEAHSPSVLSEHRSRISRYLMPGKIAAQVQGPNTNSSSSSSTGAADGDLEGALRSLRKVVYAGLQQQRQQLSSSEDYQRWHMMNKLKTPHLSTLPPSDLDPWASGGSTACTSSTDLLLGRQLQELSATARGTDSNIGSSGSSSSSSSSSSKSIGAQGSGVGEGKSRAAAFLAAADAVFLNLRFDALESHRHFPLHFATYEIGHEVPAAQWMSAVMRAGQFARDMETSAQEHELMSLYTQYSLFAHSLLYTLYKMWLGSNKEEAGRYLAMPPDAGVVERFITSSMRNAQKGQS